MSLTDITKAYKYRIELHAHTSPVSGCSEIPPVQMIELLQAQGYDAVMITNHFAPGNGFWNTEDPIATYLADYQATKEAGEKAGIKVYLGVEFRFAENSNDYLFIGKVTEEFLRKMAGQLDMGIDAFYEKYHGPNHLILQAHPFRNGMIKVNPASLDGIESMNLHPNHNSRVAKATKYALENRFSVMTIGTDLHHVGHEGLAATRTKTLPADETELVALLRSRDYLFEVGGAVMFPYDTF